MHSCQIFVKTGIAFSNAEQALTHIGQAMLHAGVVKSSYPQALLCREAEFPTGIMLENQAIAIPHCEAEHAIAPAIYLIRPDNPVPFAQADDDKQIGAALIIALIVTHPAEQLVLLRRLFNQLQDPAFVEQLLGAQENQLADIFKRQVFPSANVSSPPTKMTTTKPQHQGALS